MSAEWEQLCAAPNLTSALVQHFSFLCQSPACTTLLERVMSHAEKAEVVTDHLMFGPGSKILEITFPEISDGKVTSDGDARRLSCSMPVAMEPAVSLPDSLKRLVAIHDQIATLSGDGSFSFAFFGLADNGELGNAPDFDPRLLAEGDNANLSSQFAAKGLALADARVPISYDYSDWVLLDPVNPTSSGEPALRMVSHSSGDADQPLSSELGAASVLLRLIAARLLGLHYTQTLA